MFLTAIAVTLEAAGLAVTETKGGGRELRSYVTTIDGLPPAVSNRTAKSS